MPYRFATERRDYSDYSSGRVFYGAPGYPAFPVRLVSAWLFVELVGWQTLLYFMTRVVVVLIT